MGNDNSEKERSYLPRSWGRVFRHTGHDAEEEYYSEPDHSESYENGMNDPRHYVEDLDKETICGGEFEALRPASHIESEFDSEPCRRIDYPCHAAGARDSAGISERSEADGAPSTLTVRVAGIRFGYACKIYHFDAGDLALTTEDWVIVKTEKGVGLGQVAVAPVDNEVDAAHIDALRKIIRKAGKVDFEQGAKCSQRETEAFAYCEERIEALGLPMKLVAVECFFDGSKYVFYFTAEGRIDFRELVKQLVARFPVRIEMRQIGVRHEAKMTGGLACCGQELCCSRFLTDFRPVSVKMAKNQNLSLNPTKISGVCGRLMCCLAYEHDTYEQFKKGLPKVGKTVRTSRGDAVVLKHNPLTETICVRLEDETFAEMTKDDLVVVDEFPAQKRGDKERGTARRNKRSQDKGTKERSTPEDS
ncbi:MAG: stage 0 sporulation family protein [Desulfomonilaceae bacterium]|nr:stage 0 sporulation family protein [Desulfomonilaceae bacterium]